MNAKGIYFHEWPVVNDAARVMQKGIYFYVSRLTNVHPYRQQALSGLCFHDDPAVKVSTFMENAYPP